MLDHAATAEEAAMTVNKVFLALLLGWCVVGMGASALLSYIFGVSKFTAWTGTVPMASSTATAFVITGAAIIILCHKK